MSFSNDTNGVSVLDYNQRTNILVSHLLYGVKDGVIWSNCKNIMPFFIEQLPDRHQNSPFISFESKKPGEMLVQKSD